MLNEVLRFIKQEKLIAPQDTVIAGVSGGADSVCLLLVLMEIRKSMPFSLKAVHVEHGIRGEESKKDADFTKRLCEANGISCEVYPVDVPLYAEEKGLGMEEAARILRYRCYREAACKVGSLQLSGNEEYGLKHHAKEQMQNVGKIHIALAHHAEDNAETILFQMVRGSGLDGLCGILPKREFDENIDIIRPLLKQTRGNIENFLRERKQEYCVDSTNMDTEYSRNQIRHEIIPTLKEINRQAVTHINQCAEILRDMKDYLDVQVAKAYEQSCVMQSNAMKNSADQSGTNQNVAKENGRLQVKWEHLKEYPLIIQKEVIHKAICEVAQSAKDITAVHVEHTLHLLTQQVGKRISLPYQMMAERNYAGIAILKKNEQTGTEAVQISIEKEKLESFLDGQPHFFDVPGGKFCFQVRDFTGKMQEISKKTYTKCLDYDKIKGDLQIRNRQSGDYLTLDTEGHTKRLKEYFINEKIPSEDRDRIFLLTQESHVIWVVGGRISAEFKIKENTKRILEVQFEGGNDNEN